MGVCRIGSRLEQRGGEETYVGPTDSLKANFAENISHLVLARGQNFVLRLSLFDIYSIRPTRTSNREVSISSQNTIGTS